MQPLDNNNMAATRIAVKFNTQLNPTFNAKLSAKLTARLSRTIGEVASQIHTHLIPNRKIDPVISGKGIAVNKKS